MRLTNNMRDGILEKELAEKFHDKITKLEKDIYDEIELEVKKTVPKNIPKELLDKGYIRKSPDVEIKDMGFRERREAMYPSSIDTYYPCSDYSHKVKETKKLKSKSEKLKAKTKERKEFHDNLRRVLYSFTTDTKLVANVPELKKYFKDQEKAKNMAIVPADLICSVRNAISGKRKC